MKSLGVKTKKQKDRMNIRIMLIQLTHVPCFMPHGFANGYVGVPKGHPWFGKGINDIEVRIHGGLTYSEDRLPFRSPDGLWWVGFDTCHAFDDYENCDEDFCIDEVEKLRKQAEKASNLVIWRKKQLQRKP